MRCASAITSSDASMPSTFPGATRCAMSAVIVPGPHPTSSTFIPGVRYGAKYAAEFTKVYPNVHVKFEPVVDYEGDVKIRLNSSDYGDVLMIPASVPVADYPRFFAPLGTPADLSQKYRFVEHRSKMIDRRQRQCAIPLLVDSGEQ